MKFKHLLFIGFITLIVSITGCSSTSQSNNGSPHRTVIYSKTRDKKQ